MQEQKKTEQVARLDQCTVDELVQELSKRLGVRAYETGIYAPHDVALTRKYQEDRSPVDVPSNATVLVIERL